MNNPLKISVDYHGVITSNPIFFKAFNQLALNENIKIIVLSGAHNVDVKAYLEKNHIPYTYVWSLLDDFKQRNLVAFNDDGSFHVADDIWNKAKARYCKEQNIDLHIDDSMLYGLYFQTPFCLYTPTEQKCQILKENIPIDFNQSAQKVLDEIIKALEGISSK